jgi:hypothetical protein
MLHQPAVQNKKDFAIAYKMRIGVWMFCLYAAFYGGFVIWNVLRPIQMGEPLLFGMSVAVVFGFGLIIFALGLALIYNHMCGRKEKLLNSGSNVRGGKN